MDRVLKIQFFLMKWVIRIQLIRLTGFDETRFSRCYFGYVRASNLFKMRFDCRAELFQ